MSENNPLEEFIQEYTSKREKLERRTETLRQNAIHLLNDALSKIAGKRKIIREAYCKKIGLLNIECDAVIEANEDDEIVKEFKGYVEGYETQIIVLKHHNPIDDSNVLLIKMIMRGNKDD